MKTLVAYYSKSGNNEYLARRLASELGCDCERIAPRFGGMFFQLLFTAFKKGFGIRSLSRDPAGYDRVVVCGPLWMGHLAYPALAFIKRHGVKIPSLCFATCCGCDDSQKDDQFGYGAVFTMLEGMMRGKLIAAEAFSVGMILPEGAPSEEVMKARLSDANFTGAIAERFARFLVKVKA
ncbi:MAG TPA: hypothetical protein PKO22_13105 [Treponemataceae bacterium]|nr:hypothetical protein [Treponemataceae bacterium]